MSLLTSKMIRSGLVLAMATGVLSTLSGCTDDEVVASALVIGAAAIVADDSPDVVVVHEDHYHHGYHRGYGHYHRHDLAAQASSAALDAAAAQASAAAIATSPAAAAFVSKDKRVINLAKNYEIPQYAATYIVRAVVLAQSKDMSGVKDLGLSAADLKNLYQGQELSTAKVETLATKLQMDSASTTRFVQEFVADAKAAKADR